MCQTLPLHAAEPVYDAATYFSAGENPSGGGVWSWRGKWDGKNNLGRDGNYALLPEQVEIPFPPASGNDEPGWGPLQPSADGLFLPAVWRYQGTELADPLIIDGNRYRARPGVLLAHPGSARLVSVTWQAPRAGTIALAAQFQDAVTGSPGADSGVSWFVQLRGESPLATGDLGSGGTSALLERHGLAVKQGDFVHFGMDPRGGNVTDTTALLARISYGPDASPAADQLLDAPLPSGPGGGATALRQLPGGNQTLRYGGGTNDFVVLQGDTDVTDFPIVSGGVTTNYVASGTLAYDQALRYDLSGATVNLKGGTVVSFKYWSSTNPSAPGYVISGTLSSTASPQTLPYGYAAGYSMAFQPDTRIEFAQFQTPGIASNGYVLKGYAAAAQSVIFSYLAGGSLIVQAGSACSFHHSPTNGSAQAGYLKVAWPAADTYLPYSYTSGVTAKVRAGTAAVFRHFKVPTGSATAGFLESGILAENSVLYYGTGVTLTAKIDTPVTFTFSTPNPNSLVASYGYVRDCIPAVNASVRFGSQAGALATILANNAAKFSRLSATSHAGFLDSATLAPPGPVSFPYTTASPIRYASLAVNKPAAFARVSTTNGTGFLASGILSGAQTVYTSTGTTVIAADGSTLSITTPGTTTVIPPPIVIIDNDGDGFSEAEEILMGTSDFVFNDPQADGNPQSWPQNVQERTLVVVGDSAVNVQKSGTKLVTIPAGSGTWLLVRAIKSREFPFYTHQASVFNDTVSGSVSGVAGGSFPSTNVNSLHQSWVAASSPVKSFLGYSPVDVEVRGSITAHPSASTPITLSLTVTNISDDLLSTTGILSLIPVEFITPAGDPVLQPIDAGSTPANTPDGANEFTFSTAAAGVLTMKFKAKVAGVSSMSVAEQAKFTFEMDAVGNSTLAWDTANPGGKATVSGDFITASATYTGLPQNNTDFGLKKARVKHGAAIAGEAKFEVFFPLDSLNYPFVGPIQGSFPPNWYWYWKLSSANFGTHSYYPATGPFAGFTGYTVFVGGSWNAFLMDGITGHPPGGTWNNAEGIDLYAHIARHEDTHRTQMIGMWGVGSDRVLAQDTDDDNLKDTVEANLIPGHPYNPAKKETYMDAFNYNPSPGPLLDVEDYCLRQQPSWTNGSANTEDWANPGMQHKTLNDADD